MTRRSQPEAFDPNGPSLAWPTVVLGSARKRSRPFWALVVVTLMAVIGVFDYRAPFEVSFLVFYLFPVAIAVVTLGGTAGAAAAAISVAVSLAGDIAGGAHFANRLAPWWNALIVWVTYLLVVWLLTALKSAYARLLANQRELEDRVRERTAALTEEIAERKRLERAVLEIGERERRSIGHDLHDGLGQHLTGTALAVQMLANRLESFHPAEAAEARKAVAFIERAIDQTRELAKGLLGAEVEPDALVAALSELAASAQDRFRLACVFTCEDEINLEGNGTASHVYHIAQEALRNAARHSGASRVDIVLAADEGGISLRVSDNGRGLPPAGARAEGLGLRIMAHRAALIGAQFAVGAPPGGGTVVSCGRIAAAPPP